jgi:hypothetical protein
VRLAGEIGAVDQVRDAADRRHQEVVGLQRELRGQLEELLAVVQGVVGIDEDLVRRAQDAEAVAAVHQADHAQVVAERHPAA